MEELNKKLLDKIANVTSNSAIACHPHLGKKDKVLIVAAHPDDDVLGCGGTIAFLREKKIKVRVVFLAEGISARYLQKDIGSFKVKNEIDYRNKCALKALKILGVNKEEIFFNKTY